MKESGGCEGQGRRVQPAAEGRPMLTSAQPLPFDVVAGDDVVVETRIMPLELDPESSSSGTSWKLAQSKAIDAMRPRCDCQDATGAAEGDERTAAWR